MDGEGTGAGTGNGNRSVVICKLDLYVAQHVRL